MATDTQKKKLRLDASQKYLNADWPDLLRKTVPLFKVRAQIILEALTEDLDEPSWETWVRDKLLVHDVYTILETSPGWGPVALLLLGDVPRFARNLRAGNIAAAAARGVRPSNAVGRTVWSHLSDERTRLLRGERAHPANQDDADLDRLSGDAPTEDHLNARIDLNRIGIADADISRMPDVTEVRARMLSVCMKRLREERPEHHKAVAIHYGFVEGDGALTRHRKETDAKRALTWLRECLRNMFTTRHPTEPRG